MQTIDIPHQIAEQFPKLSASTLQRLSSFQPDKGPAIKRPISTPVDTLAGQITVSQEGYQFLQNCKKNPMMLLRVQSRIFILAGSTKLLEQRISQGGIESYIYYFEVAEYKQSLET